MSFTDQLPRIANEDDVKMSWSGGKNGKYFRCKLCGHKFIVGDQYRFVFCQRFTNVIVCKDCDGTNEEVREEWIKLHEEFEELSNGKFWSFVIPQEDNSRDEQREFAREARELQKEADYWKREATYAKQERNW